MTDTLAPAPADFSRVDPRVVALLAERWARRHGVLPIALESGTLMVATSDPLDLDAERAVSFATGHRIRWVLASAAAIALQTDRWYGEERSAGRSDPLPPTEVQHLAFGGEGADDHGVDAGASVTRLVDQLLADGIR